jgi:hypothetical protein
MKRIFIVILLVFSFFTVFAQTGTYKWFNPVKTDFPVIEGRAWLKETAGAYDRFPARAQKSLNPNVWNISHSSAGLYIKFKTDAPNWLSGIRLMASLPCCTCRPPA